MVAIFTFDFDAQLHADAAAFFISFDDLLSKVYTESTVCILSPKFATVVGCSMPRVGCRGG